MLIQVIFKGPRKEKRKGVQGVQSSTAVAEGAALMGTAPHSNREVDMLRGTVGLRPALPWLCFLSMVVQALLSSLPLPGWVLNGIQSTSKHAS